MTARTAEPEVTGAVAQWDVKQLLRADAFPHSVSNLELRETHLSWVILTGALAYKIKKPVQFDFIDASTIQRRQHYCNEELRLNRRLAADLYLSIVPISLDSIGLPRIGISTGAIVDYAVCMRQFDSSSELATLLEQNAVVSTEMAHLARLLAMFHLSAAVSSGMPGEKTQSTYDNVFSNLDALLSQAQDFEPLPGLERLADWTKEQAQSLEMIVTARARDGWVRECHGDLHARNIVRWRNRFLPFDCLEFDPELRSIDVMSDLAFLVMDLLSYGRDDLAAVLLNEYLEITGDYDGVRVLPFYAVYRALVRAKVDALMTRQHTDHLCGFQRRLRRRVRAALAWLDRPRSALILMHGPSGSGKSWLSERLVSSLPALRIRSDVERKRFQAREDVTQSDPYTAAVNHRTYARLLECAESGLQAGFNVIVDAAFLDPADRELFLGLAGRLRRPCAIVSCQADPATLTARIQERALQGTDPSDADRRVLELQLSAWRPLDDSEHAHAIFADTRHPQTVRQVSAELRARISSDI
jgi:uncharacterized protein